MSAFHLREEILKEHSRAQALKIASWIGRDAERFAQLISLFMQDEYRVVQRAAWVLSTVAGKQPALIAPHLPEIVYRMNAPCLPVAVKRNVVRILQYIEVPESLHGQVMNSCFELLADVKETVAVRAFSMTVLASLAKKYPDIKSELRATIEDGLEHQASAGFKSRGLKVLKALG